ncbi:hypothetical protein OH768_07360 [Streptomyces sp. NBC_01622]|uniref:hypothetical protein n=1 Tax=Streptomyces sp. NBC_01622 TaxID=2975903 RepID=UPI003870528D|nr:hypothetical protein OH768_07360 [Streptomyces sp. NBC_01622]
MNTQWHGISRRRGAAIAGAVAALLVSGGVAVAATSSEGTVVKHGGVTLSEVPGNPHPHHIQPGTGKKLRDLPVTKGGPVTGEKPSLVEVPGAKPHNVKPGKATLMPGAPVVVGDEGNTGDAVTTLPGHTRR